MKERDKIVEMPTKNNLKKKELDKIKNKSRSNGNGREETHERIIVEIRWIDLIIRYQESIEREESDDGFSPGQ